MDVSQGIKAVGITGATGAIGLALIEAFIEKGTEVYVFVRSDSKRISRIPEHELVHRVFCSLDEMAVYDTKDIPKLDVFYHFAWMKAFGEAARDDLKTQIKNIEYAVDSVALAKRLGCRRYIGAGSQAEYGRKDGALGTGTKCDPENGYGMAKLAAGEMTGLECEKLGLEHIWVRVLSVYGPGDGEGTLVMSVIKDALAGKAPECTGGRQIWDYLYSGDAGDAFRLLGERGIPGKTYVLGSGTSKPLRDYIDLICEACSETMKESGTDDTDGKEKKVTPVYGARPYGKKQVMHLEADISVLQEDTGFIPKTGFYKGIRETIDWVRNTRTQ